MRDAIERPEGMDAGTWVIAGLAPDRLLDAVRCVRDGWPGRRFAGRVSDYEAGAVSAKVVRIVLSYIDQVDRVVWSKQPSGPTEPGLEGEAPS